MRNASFLEFILLAVCICRSLQDKALNYHAMRSKPPYIQTQAEFWAFDNQINENLKFYSRRLGDNAKIYFLGRNQDPATLPSLSRNVEVKSSGGRMVPFELNLRNGLLSGLSDIKIAPYSATAYQGLDVVYSSDVKFSKDLKIVHDFTILRSGTGFKGKVEGLVKDLHYLVSTRFNLDTKRITMEEFKTRCFKGMEVNATGLPTKWVLLTDEIKNIAMGWYKDSIMNDIKTLTYTALEDTFSGTSIAEFITRFNFSIDYGKDAKKYDRPEQVKLCPPKSFNASTNTTLIKRVMLSGKHPYMAFIQNEAEMLAFERLLKKSINDYVEDFRLNALEDLINRDLGKAKVQNFEREFTAKDSEMVERTGLLRFKKGWISSLYNFENDEVHLVEIDGHVMTVTWRINLDGDFEFEQDFEAIIMRHNYKGSVKVKLDSISYLIRIKIDLKTFNVDISDFYMECKGLDIVEVSELGTMHGRLAEGISKEAKAVFNDYALDVVEKLLIQAIESAKYRTKIKSYLPKWNYKRDFTKEEEEEDIPESAIATCGESELKEMRYKGFDQSYSAVVVPNPVPFIRNYLELRSFADKLKVGLNKYMELILHEASSIITIQELKKSKLPDVKLALDYTDVFDKSWSGEVALENNWVEDVSDINKRPDSIDYIRINAKNILFTAKISLWSYLQFTSDFTANVSTKPILTGNVSIDVWDSIYLFAVRVDYIDSPEVTLDEIQLKCTDKIAVAADGFLGLEPWEWHMQDGIKEVVSKVYVRDALEYVRKLFRRSLEDAISNNDVRKFFPDWDMTRVYTDESPQKPKTYFRPCNSTDSDGPKVAAIYKNEKYIGFEDFLQALRIHALREFFKKTNPREMLSYAKELWRRTWRTIIDNYVDTKLPDYDRMFNVQGPDGTERTVALKLSNGANMGLSMVKTFEKVDVAYAENDEVIFLATERFSELEFKYDFTLKISEKFEGNGTIEGSAKNVKNMMKVRMNMYTKRFTFEDYDLFCFDEATTAVQGLNPEHRWLEKYVENEGMKVFMGPVFEDLITLRGAMLRDAAPGYKGEYSFPTWMLHDKIFQIAISNETDERRTEKRIKLLKECDAPELNNTDESHMEYKGNLPFIGTEAEWWYFDKHIKSNMRYFVSDVIGRAYTFIKDQECDKLKLPNYSRKHISEGWGATRYDGELNFLNGIVEDLSDIFFRANSNIEFEGTELLLTSYIKFDEKIKFRSDVESKSEGKELSGSLEGTAESLKYVFRVRINLKTRVSNLEDVKLNCIGGVQIDLRGFGGNDSWMSKMITGVFTDVFLGPILDDVGKVINIALERGVYEVLPSFLKIPTWNYELDYTKRRQIKNEEGNADYGVCTPRNTTVEGPDDDSIIFLNRGFSRFQ